jgi:hypothetical protein
MPVHHRLRFIDMAREVGAEQPSSDFERVFHMLNFAIGSPTGSDLGAILLDAAT